MSHLVRWRATHVLVGVALLVAACSGDADRSVATAGDPAYASWPGGPDPQLECAPRPVR
jgi:hypothetical protein